MDKFRIRFELLLLVVLFCCCEGVKITMLQLFGKSHYLTTKVIGEELARRGHEVTLFYPGTKEDLGKHTIEKHGLQVIHVYQGFDFEEVQKALKPLSAGDTGSLMNTIEVYYTGFRLFSRTCNALMSDPVVVQSIKDADLLVAELTVFCNGLIAKKYKKKWVALSSTSEADLISYLYRVYLNPSHFQSIFTVATGHMGFAKRIENFLMHQMFIYFYTPFLKYCHKDTIANHGLPDTDMVEELSSAEVIIGNCDFTFLYPYPQMPNDFCVGGFLQRPAEKLPEELQSYMDSAQHGVILVAFGSLVDIRSKRQIETMAAAFKKLKQHIIWLLTDTLGVDMPVNVKLLGWLPQNDILAHLNLKLFVTHAGQSSMQETGYHGVPVVAVPFGADQIPNAHNLVYRLNMGKLLEMKTATVEDWFHAIQDVLSNKSYSLNAKKVSKRLRSKKRTPVEHAGDLIQYVIDNDGDVSHLKSRGHHLPWHVVNLWDVYAFILFIVITTLFLSYLLFKKILNVISGTKIKKE